MRKRHGTQALMTEINITPFTDVILVLLIIFMIATPLLSQNTIALKLPESSSKGSVDAPQQAYISITGEGVVYLDNKVVTKKELKQQMDAWLKKDPNINVVVAADQACRFQEVVGVIDILKRAGARNLNIATRTGQ